MPENRFAILIGTSNYKPESGLPNLRCPEKDVDGLAEALSSYGGEFTELIPIKNQTCNQLMDKLIEIFAQAKKDDLIFIYYSGHGKQNLSGQLYLTTSDTLINPPLRLKNTSVAVQDICDLINQSRVSKIILILDCCYSGAAEKAFKSDIITPLQTLAQSEGRGIYVISSSTHTQVSLEKEGDEYSLMTKHIIEALSNGTSLMDEEGFVRISNLYNYIRAKVEEESHQRPMEFVLKREGRELIVARVPTTVKSLKKKIVLLYKRGVELDELLRDYLRTQLTKVGCEVFFDLKVKIGMDWAKEINSHIQSADAVIPLISKAAIQSDILPMELQVAREFQRKTGKPRILPVRIGLEEILPNTEYWTEVSALLDSIQYVLWESKQDNELVISEILAALQRPEEISIDLTQLEAVGGAVPFDSRYYVVRSTDNDFLASINRCDGIVLIKGARQMGKTSLLQRGLNLAEKNDSKVVFIDFQTFNTSQLETIDKFYQVMCYKLAKSLDINLHPKDTWDEFAGPNDNFNDFVKKILEQLNGNLVWGLDEVDRLFTCSYGTEVFGNLRSWYNDRANPNSIWKKLTLAVAYATESHLFIRDLDQSPFNVGTLLTLSDFTPEQVENLNNLYGCPLKNQRDLKTFYELFAGQPYLIRLGLDEMTRKKFSVKELKKLADSDEEPFGNHLRRFLILLAHDEELCDIVRTVLQGGKCPTEKSFYRLRSAGLISGSSLHVGQIRCLAYANYLKNHLL